MAFLAALHLRVSGGRDSLCLLFWPAIFTVIFVTLPLQRLRELTKRPFLPPFIFKANLVTGTSGRPSIVLRIWALTESMRPWNSTSTGWFSGPLRAIARSGSWWSEDLRKTGPVSLPSIKGVVASAKP